MLTVVPSLCRFENNNDEREIIWSLTKKCEEVDPKKAAGCALDQFQANRVIEALLMNESGDFLSFKEVRDIVSKTGFEAKKTLSLIDFAVYKLNLDPKQIMLAEQVDDFDPDALMTAAADRWTAADATAKEAAAKFAEAGVAVAKAESQLKEASDGRAKISSMEDALAAELAELELKAKNAEGAVKVAKAKSELERAKKAGESDELRTLKSRIPDLQKKGAKNKATADEVYAAAEKAKKAADEALAHATDDSELNTYVVAGCGKGAVWFIDKEEKSKAINR